MNVTAYKQHDINSIALYSIYIIKSTATEFFAVVTAYKRTGETSVVYPIDWGRVNHRIGSVEVFLLRGNDHPEQLLATPDDLDFHMFWVLVGLADMILAPVEQSCSTRQLSSPRLARICSVKLSKSCKGSFRSIWKSENPRTGLGWNLCRSGWHLL